MSKESDAWISKLPHTFDKFDGLDGETLKRERDAALAEVDRLRSWIKGLHDDAEAAKKGEAVEWPRHDFLTHGVREGTLHALAVACREALRGPEGAR